MIHRADRHTSSSDSRLPAALVRPVVGLIDLIQRFEPEHDYGDQNWEFFVKLGRLWAGLQAKLYNGTWYFLLHTEREHERPQSFQYNPTTTAHEGVDEIGAERLRALQTAIAGIFRAVKQDPVAYHAELTTTLAPTMQYGVIHRSLVRELLPDWSRFDRELSADERTRCLAILSDRDPAPLPQMTSGRFFEYVKTAYLANPKTFAEYGETIDPTLSGRDLYCRYADGRDGGLRDIDQTSEAAFARWYDEGAASGGHPYEIFRGGNSTHIDLHVQRTSPPEGAGWQLTLSAFSSTRLVETCRAALALHERSLPCAIAHRESYILRLRGEDYVGIVPNQADIKYGWQNFPKEFNVADTIRFGWFRDEDSGRQLRPWREIRQLVTWLPLRPLRLAMK